MRRSGAFGKPGRAASLATPAAFCFIRGSDGTASHTASATSLSRKRQSKVLRVPARTAPGRYAGGRPGLRKGQKPRLGPGAPPKHPGPSRGSQPFLSVVHLRRHHENPAGRRTKRGLHAAQFGEMKASVAGTCSKGQWRLLGTRWRCSMVIAALEGVLLRKHASPPRCAAWSHRL